MCKSNQPDGIYLFFFADQIQQFDADVVIFSSLVGEFSCSKHYKPKTLTKTFN